jgi:hypothetical protein
MEKLEQFNIDQVFARLQNGECPYSDVASDFPVLINY